jgi:predicted HTH transcriptional regulator
MTAEGIMAAIVSDSTITIPRIAEVSGSSVRTVKRYLKEFQDGDILKREGSDTSGEWILF